VVDDPVVSDPSFDFRLERVRALRERGEGMAQEELAGALSHLIDGEALLRAARERLDGAQTVQREVVGSGAASASDLIAVQAYVERSERVREERSLDRDRREAEVNARRVALERAAQERQVLERLKLRQRADHDRVVARREGNVLDEIAIAMHRRGAAA
jgi:flagellar protein FliJ